jgi:hypothetical protein
LVLLPVVGLEQVLGDQTDPLPVGRAELVADVVRAVEAALVEHLLEEEPPEALAGQEVAEDRLVKRGRLLEAGALRVDNKIVLEFRKSVFISSDELEQMLLLSNCFHKFWSSSERSSNLEC